MDRPGSVSPAYDCRIKVGFKWAFKVAYGEDNGQDCGSSSPLWSSWFSAEIRSIRVARRGHRWWWWWWRPRVLYLGFKGPDQGLAFTAIVPRILNLGMSFQDIQRKAMRDLYYFDHYDILIWSYLPPLHFPARSCPMHSVFLMPSFTRLNHVSPVHITTWTLYLLLIFQTSAVWLAVENMDNTGRWKMALFTVQSGLMEKDHEALGLARAPSRIF
jgi:hypothetical protein